MKRANYLARKVIFGSKNPDPRKSSSFAEITTSRVTLTPQTPILRKEMLGAAFSYIVARPQGQY